MRFLVTAGNTREKIDAVRDWGSIFTGDTGFAIATALAAAGEVDLLTSNRLHLAQVQASTTHPQRMHASGFTSHEQLKGALAALMSTQRYDAIFMTAAVADYKPVRVYEVETREPLNDGAGRERWSVRDAQAAKVKSTHDAIAVFGQRTEKLVDLFRREWRHRGLLVKFKLEVGLAQEELIRAGQQSRKSSGAEYLVANTLDMVEGEPAGAFLLSDQGHEWVPREQLAQRLVQLVQPAESSRQNFKAP